MSLPKLFKSALLDLNAVAKFLTAHRNAGAHQETASATLTANAQATSIGTRLLADCMAAVKAADAAAKAKGLNLVLDAQVIAEIETLVADIERVLPGSTAAVPAN